MGRDHAGSPFGRWLRRRVPAMAALALLAGCGDSTGLGLSLVSEDQVQEMGLESWQRVVAETRPSSNDTYRRAAAQVSARLLRAAGEDPAAWEVRVFADDQANAFALPGRKIGVYEGLFGYARDEAQLAAVIGHEIAHNQRNHAGERLSSQLATEAGVQVVASALQLGNIGYANQIAAVLGMGAQYGLILPYSRNQELEADRLGLLLMAKAGYDPRASVALWQNMAGSGPRPPTFLSTHPGPEDRIAALQRLMPEALDRYRAR